VSDKAEASLETALKQLRSGQLDMKIINTKFINGIIAKADALTQKQKIDQKIYDKAQLDLTVAKDKKDAIVGSLKESITTYV